MSLLLLWFFPSRLFFIQFLHHIGHVPHGVIDGCLYVLEYCVIRLLYYRHTRLENLSHISMVVNQVFIEMVIWLDFRWFFRLAHNEKTAHRQFAIEVRPIPIHYISTISFFEWCRGKSISITNISIITHVPIVSAYTFSPCS